jgi:hypothetical protein
MIDLGSTNDVSNRHSQHINILCLLNAVNVLVSDGMENFVSPKDDEISDCELVLLA